MMNNEKLIFSQSPNFSASCNRLKSLDYHQVTLLPGLYKDAYERCYAFYMGLDADDILFEMRKKAGIGTRNGKSLIDAENSWFHLGGNVIGQWLQVYARFYRATKRREAMETAEKLIDGLYEIAAVSPVFFDGMNMYFFEKYLRGFTDIYLYCGKSKAFGLGKRLLDEAMTSDIYEKPQLLLGNNGPGNEIEWYTISESILYFSDVYERDGGDAGQAEAYRKFAEKFSYWEFWNIFHGEDWKHFHNFSPLGGQNTAYFHAYSHVNTFNSALYFYSRTKDSYYLDSAVKFYDWLTENQTLATGAYGTHTEWLMPKTGIVNALHNFHDTYETQCNSYAAYRISNFLLTESALAKYADWPELLFYNATLASLDTDEKGHAFYYSDYNISSSHKYLHPCSWTCCTGTRPLLLNELLRSVYFYDADSIYIALFTESAAEIDGVSVAQLPGYPYSGYHTIAVSAVKPCRRRIKIRIPSWSDAQPGVTAEGKALVCAARDGWLILDETWEGRREIKIDFGNRLHTHTIRIKNGGAAAVMYGPVGLAAAAVPGIVAGDFIDFENIVESLEQTGPARFRCRLNEKIIFKPFSEFSKDEPYQLYHSLTRQIWQDRIAKEGKL